MKLVGHGTRLNKIWRCSTHKNRKTSQLAGSFWENSHLSLSTIVKLIYAWAHQMPSKMTVTTISLSKISIDKWYSKLRKVSSEHFQENSFTVDGQRHYIQHQKYPCLRATIPQKRIFTEKDQYEYNNNLHENIKDNYRNIEPESPLLPKNAMKLENDNISVRNVAHLKINKKSLDDEHSSQYNNSQSIPHDVIPKPPSEKSSTALPLINKSNLIYKRNLDSLSDLAENRSPKRLHNQILSSIKSPLKE